MENRGGCTFYPKPKSTRQDSWEALQTFLKAKRRGKKRATEPPLLNIREVQSEERRAHVWLCVVVKQDKTHNNKYNHIKRRENREKLKETEQKEKVDDTMVSTSSASLRSSADANKRAEHVGRVAVHGR
ncbi:Hypothetical predicted protein [Scomber scombrus]|uniref:Uncharacterized protein n=1 Tax=Scomber scombrus TaxID=13677 RepID=A0AAV1MSQ5_SCOSC